MIATFIPVTGVLNSAPLMFTKPTITARLQACLLANLNSFAMDFVARQKVGGVHLNFFIVEQLPIFPPDFYQDKCPWNPRQSLEKWISDRVLKLTCTANDMIPLAHTAGMNPPVRKWKLPERLDLMAQLDAAYFILYGLKSDDVRYVLSTFSAIGSNDKAMFTPGNISERILSFYEDLNTKSKGHIQK